jgi:hypothetical protein
MQNKNSENPDSGSWGRLSSESRSAAVIRFILPDRTISFPYHTLTQWVHSVGDAETLEISAGTLLVTVRGRNLVRLRDGLDAGRLEQAKAQGDRAALRASPQEPCIQGIQITPQTNVRGVRTNGSSV